MSATTTPPRRSAIVAVADEPAVLAAVSRDLRQRFGERHRSNTRPSPSPPSTLESRPGRTAFHISLPVNAA